MQNKVFIILTLSIITIISGCKQQNSNTNSTKNISKDSTTIIVLSKEIKNKPKDADLYAKRADLYQQQGNLTSAIKDLTIANALDSLNPTYYITLADFYIQLGNSGVTASLLNKANLLIPDNIDILYRLGNLYFYVQDYNKALQYLNETMSIDPYYPMAFFTKALLMLEKGDTATAISNLQIAVEREPEYYDAYIQLALLFSTKNNPIALNYYDNALALFPDSFEALYGKAMFLQNNSQANKAIAVYQEILQTGNKNKKQVYFNIGYNYMLFLEEYKTAITYYDSTIAEYEIYPEALCNRAFCYEKTKQKSKAREDYKKALTQSPNFELAIVGLNRLDKQ